MKNNLIKQIDDVLKGIKETNDFCYIGFKFEDNCFVLCDNVEIEEIFGEGAKENEYLYFWLRCNLRTDTNDYYVSTEDDNPILVVKNNKVERYFISEFDEKLAEKLYEYFKEMVCEPYDSWDYSYSFTDKCVNQYIDCFNKKFMEEDL